MIITSDDILGKEALDSDAGFLGTVVKLHIDKIKKLITGVTIDQGFLKPDLFVGIDYIKTFGVDAIFLNQVPYDALKGHKVLTINGEDVGLLKQVIMKGKIIHRLLIKTEKEVIEVKASSIKEIGQCIILRKNRHSHKK